MSKLAEGDRVVFEGIADEDGPWPGDHGMLLAIAGRGGFVQFDTDTRTAGALQLVLMDDLAGEDEYQEGT